LKRQVKFYKEFLNLQRFSRKELTRYFFKANNLVFVQQKESLSRLGNRCLITGSTHTLKKFRLSRQTFRSFANSGYLPGVRKASW
jgi:ribosomal protein S14